MAQVFIKILVSEFRGVSHLHRLLLDFLREMKIHQGCTISTLDGHSLKLIKDDGKIGG